MLQSFENRIEGGKALAERLLEYKSREDLIILALPRGGVPVAFEVAKALNANLDVFIVRKLGVPSREELALGAIASGGTTVFNKSLIETFRIPDSLIEEVITKEQTELERRENLYREGASALDLENKTVILIDDGIATGATMSAAVTVIRMSEPREIVIASPVASIDACDLIIQDANERCVFLLRPEPFFGVGRWYKDFTQVSDAEVCDLLEDANKMASGEKLQDRKAA